MTQASSPARRARPLLGTLVEMQAHGPDIESILRAAFSEIEEVQRLMSRFSQTSDIGRLNAAPAGTPVEVHDKTRAVLAAAAELHAQSFGAFDCEQRGAQASASLCPGWRLDGRSVIKLRPLEIDLGGIAKGYAVDCAIETMVALGVEFAFVNAGGDMRHAGSGSVRIALREPGMPAQTASHRLLANAALASSCVGGILPSPESAPRILGHGAQALPLSAGVSIMAASCMLADGLTKVVLASGNPAHPLIPRYGAQVLLYRDGAHLGAPQTLKP